ncbi:hypothetical protein EZV62_027045 [Acer yangbiense]|uniref:CCHC-type domain-containing protein n=1 Tax=Acer yangbiense TaxID=1000413 RepID=A0A5C7GSL8_9ROSI|nr:hypothetical protein EZV62_027045 [Acer yangbiense]
MESSDIACLCASLSLTEKDGPVQILEENLKIEAVHRMSLYLMGKLLSNKVVNKEAFIRVISRIWQVSRGVEVESVSGNIFSFHFHCEEDRQRVIAGGPWNFDDELLVLEKPVGKGVIETLSFNLAKFWIQIHQISIICMTRKIGWFLGGLIGEVLDVDGGNTREARGKFMRVRVRIDIKKPLKRCLGVDIMGDGAETLMILRYERLRIHCFKCGMVDHKVADCLVVEPIPVINGVELLSFRIWMRASPPFNTKNYKGNKDFGIKYRIWVKGPRDDNQSSPHHQQNPAIEKDDSRSEKERENQPMEEERGNSGEQVKAPPLTEKMAESCEGEVVTLDRSEVDMFKMGSVLQENIVNKTSQSINGELLHLQSDPVLDIGPDPSPSSKLKGSLSKIEPNKNYMKMAQRKGRMDIANGSGKQKKQIWVRKVRLDKIGEIVLEPILEKPPFKRKIGNNALPNNEYENDACRKILKIEIQMSTRLEGSLGEESQGKKQDIENQEIIQRVNLELGSTYGSDEEAQNVTGLSVSNESEIA